MAYETLEDIIENVLDRMGCYGSHDTRCNEVYRCRVCTSSELRNRIRNAVEVEEAIRMLRERNPTR